MYVAACKQIFSGTEPLTLVLHKHKCVLDNCDDGWRTERYGLCSKEFVKENSKDMKQGWIDLEWSEDLMMSSRIFTCLSLYKMFNVYLKVAAYISFGIGKEEKWFVWLWFPHTVFILKMNVRKWNLKKKKSIFNTCIYTTKSCFI